VKILKKTRIPITVTMLLLSFIMAFSIRSVSAQETYLKIIDSETGESNFSFPPETPINTTFIANITVTDVSMLAVWQINLTWNPSMLEIAKVHLSGDPSLSDIYFPEDNVFGDYPDPTTPTYTPGMIFWVVGIKATAPFEYVDVTYGTLCQIKFTILKNDTGGELSCDMHFVLKGESPVYTKLIDLEGDLISYIPVDGSYVIPEFPTVILPVLFLITTLLALILRKKTLPEKRQCYSPNIQAVR
jgi:hypothetical protein